LPASADSSASGTAAAVDRAHSHLESARAQAAEQDTALTAAQSDLAAAQAQVAAVEAETVRVDAEANAEKATLDRLLAQERQDQRVLAENVRATYEAGLDSGFAYIVGAESFGTMIQRQAAVSRVAEAMAQVASRLEKERHDAEAALQQTERNRARLAVLQAQAAAALVVVQNQEDRVQAAALAADSVLAQAQRDLNTALAAQAAANRPKPKPVLPPAPPVLPGPAYAPGSGSTFTVDTDLTQPSGVTAQQIDDFLSGTPMAGLGAAFIAAERNYHVSARYFVAHAVNESGWGRSQIAQDKHNLFGYGADDAHPYQDAYSFPTFADGIDFVARAVMKYYLTPGGVYYHGPTLRGVNVAYASDPHWCDKVAAIAREI